MNSVDNTSAAFVMIVLVGGIWLAVAWIILPFLLMRSLARIRGELEKLVTLAQNSPDISQMNAALSEMKDANATLTALRVELLHGPQEIR